jgi:hypothetical protein
LQIPEQLKFRQPDARELEFRQPLQPLGHEKNLQHFQAPSRHR